MAQFKFLHAADIHLDSPLRGLSRYEGVPAAEVRLATRTALTNLVELAIDEEVAFLVIAGDLYDGDWIDFGTGLTFCAAMGRLAGAGIDVYLLYGNHDAESSITRKLPLPANVHVFGTRKAVSFTHERTGAVLHGWSYRDRDTNDNLAASYPPAVPNCFNVGVLHTALTGRPPHALYAPCTVQDLVSKGYDYWALGHVHAFEIVADAPFIVYPGNLQGRTIREVGPKGAVLVTVEDDKILVPPEHVPLDAVRWSRLELEISDVVAMSALHGRLATELAAIHSTDAHGRPLMVRIELRGDCALHNDLNLRREYLREEVRGIAIAIADTLWVEKVVVATRPPANAARIDEEASDALNALVEAGIGDPALAAALRQELAEFLAKTPPDLGGTDGVLAGLRMGELDTLLADASASLVGRLKGQGG